MTIDESGRRNFFNIRIMDVRTGESVQTGYWDPDGLHSIDSEGERENYLYKSIEQKKFKISTKVVRARVAPRLYIPKRVSIGKTSNAMSIWEQIPMLRKQCD